VPFTHPKGPQAPGGDLSIAPSFTFEGDHIPRHRLPEGELAPPSTPLVDFGLVMESPRPGHGHPPDGMNRGGRQPVWTRGSSTWKRVSPGVEVKRRSPWWRWTTIRQQMSRPRPVPLPTGLVV
jgi:hypothetical protein